MCGRYTQTKPPGEIKRQLAFIGDEALLQPRYNIAPAQAAPVILASRELTLMRWGLVPLWAKEAQIGNRMINARAETVQDKPAFKRLLGHRRCLVPADGFYEWQGAGRARQPFRFRLKSDAPFAFAGLWDQWHAPEGHALNTFTILTTTANEVVRPVHDRMPVMLGPDGCEQWLAPSAQPSESLLRLLTPFPPDLMMCYPVSPLVNSPKFDGPECIQPFQHPDAPLELDLQ
jgi:putative SOS response-associated peptidase YedK